MIINIHDELKALREKAGLTAWGLAQILELQPHVIKNIENPNIKIRILSVLYYLSAFNKTLYITDYDSKLKLDAKNLGNQLKLIRTKQGILQSSMASALNTVQHAISRLENTKQYNPYYIIYARYIYALGLDLKIDDVKL